MIPIGKNTRSMIVSKGISAGHGQNAYSGMVKILKGAIGARNYTQCDSPSGRLRSQKWGIRF